MTLVPGTRLGSYEIVGMLGAGGMGEVYRAKDPKLGREVAIKVLPESFAADADRLKRFEQEARILASLTHPNILTIHDLGSHESTPFLVTELLEGRTLREELSSGAMPIAKALEVATQVARGLAAAHGKGIVHRDLKPENVFLARDGAKILDFGLAKHGPAILSAQGSESATRHMPMAPVDGSLLGTVGYMSPEQVRGEAVDARSDLFALGVLLYEMLTGRPAFAGASTADTLSAILKEEPPDLDGLAKKSTRTLVAVLRRCLEKRREDRFSTAQDLAFALQALAYPSSPGPEPDSAEKSIVVLPFENLSPDPDNAFFADGLTEELIADLSKIREIRVISRTSAMKFKGTTKGIPEIAQELRVGYVLEGSVRKAGNSLRITAQLIEAVRDAHLWAEKYSGTLDDIFELQERISRSIVEELKGCLSPEDARRIALKATEDPRIHEAWMRVMHSARTWTKDGLEWGFQVAEEAIARFGEDALLHAALGYLNYGAYDFGLRHEEATLQAAEAHSARAIELNPQLSEAHLAMGLVHYKRGNLAGFARSTGRAVELERNGDALSWHALALLEGGLPDRALVLADEGVARDPLTWWAHAVRGLVDLLEGDPEALAVRFRDTVPRLAPEEPVAVWWLAQAEAYAGHPEAAIPAFEKVEGMDAGIFSDFSRLALLALRGEREAVLAQLASGLLRKVSGTDEYFPVALANCLVMIGEHDEALDWIEQSITWTWVNEAGHRSNPHLRPLHGHPRFEALMARAAERQMAFMRSL